MLDQDSDKSLDRSKCYTVDHDRTVFLTICSCVFQFESLWKLHIQLDSSALPCSSDRVCQMEVDLRSVECSVSFIYHIVKTKVIKRTTKTFCCKFPVFITSHTVFRTCGKFYVIFESEQLIYLIDQSYNTFDLVTDLFRHHEDMCIILCETAYTHQTM